MRFMVFHIKSVSGILSCVFCALTLYGCAGHGNDVEENTEETVLPDFYSLTDRYNFLSSGASSALSSAQESGVEKINRFSFTLAEMLEEAKGAEAFVFSPISVSYGLGLLVNGAAGTTQREILDLLGFDFKEIQLVNNLFRDIMVLSNTNSKENEELRTENFVLADFSFKIKDTFAEVVKNYYGAQVAQMMFSDPGKVAGYVNDKISESSHGKIRQAVTEKEINSSTCLLVNSLYFKAGWVQQFPVELTATDYFTGVTGVKRQEEMMKLSIYGDVGYTATEDYSELTMPFGDDGVAGKYLCSFILPAEGKSLSAIINELSSEGWEPSVTFPKGISAISAKLPKFNVMLSEHLDNILKDAGLVSAFGESADFSNLSPTSSMLSMFKHVCSFSMDEAGVEASAASVAALNETSPGNSGDIVLFYADRPFLFVISDKTTRANLFIGCIK